MSERTAARRLLNDLLKIQSATLSYLLQTAAPESWIVAARERRENTLRELRGE